MLLGTRTGVESACCPQGARHFIAASIWIALWCPMLAGHAEVERNERRALAREPSRLAAC